MKSYYKYKLDFSKWVLLLITLFWLPLAVHAQNEDAIRPIIKEADLKKLGKADDLKNDADKLIEEANQLNMEVFKVQSDPDLTEKAISKKTAQLEDQARQKQIEASALYEKCNEIKFGMYKQYIDEFWKSHEGQENNYLNAKLLEEQASDNYFQASSYRIDSRKMEGLTRVEKLSEANDLENQAIGKQLSALSAYYNIANDTPGSENGFQISATTTENSSDTTIVESEIETQIIPSFTETSSQDTGIIINQSMIDAYNEYIATGQFTDTTLSTGRINSITSFNSERLLQLWYEYIYGQNIYGSEESVSYADENTKPDEETPVAEETIKKEKEIGIVTDENVGTIIPVGDEVIYRVQIAANRTKLTQRALSKMYYGNKNVEMINENGWYKYSVGDFETYEEASSFRKSSGINNAFVVAYRKGTRLVGETPEITADEQVHINYAPLGENRLPSGLIFRVQVAASRVPLNISQISRIYKGDYPVEMIYEDGWYKYQFMGVRLFSDAQYIIRNINIKGIFIVAYEDGIKIALNDAVNKNKELEKKVRSTGRKEISEIEFHLQLAASRSALTADGLSDLYGGTEPVSIIYEDGWYKYHVKTGNSFEAAEQLRQNCGIPKAFIVSYKRAAKINLYQARQELR